MENPGLHPTQHENYCEPGRDRAFHDQPARRSSSVTKSMNPRSTLVDTNLTRNLSPTLKPREVVTSLRVGDKVRVKLESTNVERGFIDFVTDDDRRAG